MYRKFDLLNIAHALCRLVLVTILLAGCISYSIQTPTPEPTFLPPNSPTPQPKVTQTPTPKPVASSTNPSLSPTPEPTKSAPKNFLYLVHEGETLGSIAEKFNIPLEYLVSSNNLDPAKPNIQVGDKLIIPSTCTLQGTQTNMPGYYQPHPALIWIASIPPLHIPSMRWIDNTHFAISRPWEGKFGCRSELWDEYALPGTSPGIIEPQTVFTETIGCTTSTPEPNRPWLNTIIGRKDFYLYFSPDGNKALTLIKTDKPTAKMRLGAASEPTEGLYDEIWLVDTGAQKARPLFFTSINYSYEWAKDSRFLVMTWDCGNSDPASVGAFITFDTQSLKSYVIEQEYFDSCGEYWGLGIMTYPNYLFYEGTLMTYQAAERTRICGEDEATSSRPRSQDGQVFYVLCDGIEDLPVVVRRFNAQTGENIGFNICDGGEFTRAFSWSQDGRYVYVSCSVKDDRSDILRRFDTQTGQVDSLTDPTQITFKAKKIYPAPGNSYLLFLWGSGQPSSHPLSFIANEEPCGIWLLDLKKLGN